jgi:hypothetical protein
MFRLDFEKSNNSEGDKSIFSDDVSIKENKMYVTIDVFQIRGIRIGITSKSA